MHAQVSYGDPSTRSSATRTVKFPGFLASSSPSASSARVQSPDAAANSAAFMMSILMSVPLVLFPAADAAMEKCSSAFWRFPERR